MPIEPKNKIDIDGNKTKIREKTGFIIDELVSKIFTLRLIFFLRKWLQKIILIQMFS